MQLSTPFNPSPPANQEAEMVPDIDQLAMAHARAVFSAAYRVTGNIAQAEDVQQNVFVRLLEKPPRSQVDNWAAYLGAMATRAAIDELRRGTRWQRLADTFLASRKSPEAMPSEALDEATRANHLRQALGRIPKRQAECFAMRFFDGMDLDAIAQALGVTPNVVSVSLNRATHSLRSRIKSIESSTTEPLENRS